ncbi:MAG: hypothetical protein WC371_05130 [Parachlamydiales bacterium]|jgi:UDP-N-acetylmuramate-alanine ligase
MFLEEKNYHFIGLGGIGMSSLAWLLLFQGKTGAVRIGVFQGF